MNTPFLKWAGGKRWLSPKLAPLLQAELAITDGHYFEPFLGGGAMFFSISPVYAVLSDVNADLIETYKEVKRNWLAVANELKNWPVSKEYYNLVREGAPLTSFGKACRLLYLNRTCYGGLYRENKNGMFNVPYGGGERTPRTLWEKGLLQNASAAMGGDVSFFCSDFEKIINKSAVGDVVYCDPTYSSKNRKQFDRYGKTIFNLADQSRLAIAAEKAMYRGVLVIISNSGCTQVSGFYPKAYKVELRKNKAIGNRAKNDSANLETLYILDPKSRRSKWQSLGEIVNRKSNSSISKIEKDIIRINEVVKITL
jgi:DNA adenine methylase